MFLLLVLACATYGVSAFQAKGSDYDKAKKLVNSGKFDQAITMLNKLADDTTRDKKERKDIFLLLSRAYVAKNLSDKAKWAIVKWLDITPPKIEPDPNKECPPWMKLFYDSWKEKYGSPAIERPDPGIQTIAILDFANRSLDDREKYDPLQKGFADLMIAQLQGSVQLKVVERERINWILSEIGLENEPGKFDDKTAVRVGKQLGVNVILFGSYFKVKNKMKLLSRLVKVETSEILATAEADGDAEQFFDITGKLGEKVAKSINVVLSKEVVEKSTPTKSLDAQMRYSEGLVLLEKGDYKGAYGKFNEALTVDPAYEQAKKKAESIKILIG
jgi:TolB-like protein